MDFCPNFTTEGLQDHGLQVERASICSSMDFCPTFNTEGLQDHGLQVSSLLSLPYMAMEDHIQNSSSSSYLPQALPMAPPYLEPFISNEGNSHTASMHGDNLPKMDNFHPSNPLYAEPIMHPGLPLWSTAAEPPLLPSTPYPFEQGQYLLNLQALLKTQYNIYLTLEELLSFDALPALLQAECDQQAPHDLGAKLEQSLSHEFNDQHASLGNFNYENMQANEFINVNQPSLQINYSANMCASPINNKLLCVNDPHRAQDISSPGSAASSSVVTDSDNSDKPLPAECIVPIPNIPSPLASVNSQSWLKPTISWLPGGEDGGALQAFTAMQLAEVVEPPAQRRKLQGITLEQVLQAEKMQQINAGSSVIPPHVQAPRNPIMGRDVLASVENMVRGGSYEVNGFREGLQEVVRSIPHPRKPAATSVEPQSIAARHRRKRIRDRTENLGMIIPGATRLDTAAMFDLAIKYVHFLQAQMFCLENEVSLTSQRSRYEDEGAAGFRRALIHRLLSSQDVQHFLSREGLCLVTESLASRLNFDPSSVLSMKGPSPPPPPPPPPHDRTI